MSAESRRLTGLRRLNRRYLAEERIVSGVRRRKFFIAALVLIVVGAASFVGLIVSVGTGTGISSLDEPVRDFMVDLRSPDATMFMVILAVIFGPVAMPFIVLAATVIWIWRAKHMWRPVLLAGAMVLGVGLALLFRDLIDRPRPPVEFMLHGADHTFSFPSGHVLGAADFLLLSAYLLLSRRQGIWLWLTGLVVAVVGIGSQIFSRLYLGYHWLTDTLGSVCLSLFILGLVIALDTWRTTTVDEGPGNALISPG
ncbi:phosphatase PAP2 family protein [Arthrobacter sp. H5]|uniref:phosphatase PAP2 family protein n=1 Tax=Arthrobacter sp. H5 TaxID=1267973 RepID=UPI0004B882FD|nr:phosphatase PAP2 family protein [Arthrobacter sp. H5]